MPIEYCEVPARDFFDRLPFDLGIDLNAPLHPQQAHNVAEEFQRDSPISHVQRIVSRFV